MKETKIKYHRIVLRRAVMEGHRWKDIPGWHDLQIDFGWFTDVWASIRKFLKEYPDHRLVWHCAITEGEVNNGKDRKETT